MWLCTLPIYMSSTNHHHQIHHHHNTLQVIAFVIGRYLLRDAVVANVTSRYAKFAAIDAALEREGWRLVVMMRLSPLVPWNVLNYLLSITGMAEHVHNPVHNLVYTPLLSCFPHPSLAPTTNNNNNNRCIICVLQHCELCFSFAMVDIVYISG